MHQEYGVNVNGTENREKNIILYKNIAALMYLKITYRWDLHNIIEFRAIIQDVKTDFK